MICDLLRIIRFFYAAPGDVRKRGAKGAGLSVVWFLGDGQITGIDVLPVIVRRILRADLQKRVFARNREAGFTGRFAKTGICP
jgi:hypothetical protein